MKTGEFISGSAPIRVDRHAPEGEGPRPAVVLLHGAGGNVQFWSGLIAPYLAKARIGLYSIHYFDRTGTSRADSAMIRDGVHFPQWMEAVSDGLGYVRTRPEVDATRVVLLGISLGAFLALSNVVHSTEPVRAVIEISGGLPRGFIPLANSRFPPTMIVHGTADTVVPVAEAHDLEALFSRFEVPCDVELIVGQGHWFDQVAQVRILTRMSHFLQKYLKDV